MIVLELINKKATEVKKAYIGTNFALLFVIFVLLSLNFLIGMAAGLLAVLAGVIRSIYKKDAANGLMLLIYYGLIVGSLQALVYGAEHCEFIKQGFDVFSLAVFFMSYSLVLFFDSVHQEKILVNSIKDGYLVKSAKYRTASLTYLYFKYIKRMSDFEIDERKHLIIKSVMKV
jgi:hypothetical protein